MSVTTPENNRTVHPEGKQLENENEEESCGEEASISRSKSTPEQETPTHESHTWKYCFMNTVEYIILKIISLQWSRATAQLF